MFLFRTRKHNNSAVNHSQGNCVYFLTAIVTSLIVSSCGENKYSQCEQIFKIAHQVTNINQNVSYAANEQPTKLKKWLEAADIMTKAAQQIKALHIDDTDLIKYQNQLVNIYQTYSEATYDAVSARESKNFIALQAARTRAIAAGKIQKNLVKKINSYCVNQK